MLKHFFPCISQLRRPGCIVFAKFATFLCDEPLRKIDGGSLNEALEVLNLLSLEKPCDEELHRHLRLIQDCVTALVRTERSKCRKRLDKAVSVDPAHDDQLLESINLVEGKNFWGHPNRTDVHGFFLQMHNQGIVLDAAVLAEGLSACGYERVLNPGRQLHALAIGTGLESYLSVGTTLVGFYVRCGYLENACQVFDRMTARNVVSWTAIISGFAQCGHAGECHNLLYRMRFSDLRPNDFTYASVLSAYVGFGSLGRGKGVHCQTIRSGFNACTHVANALVTMYAKCGSIQDSWKIFCEMSRKDLISWNAMIAGFAQHGLANHAIDLLAEMTEEKIEPDAITLLGILSSCRHAGLVDEGWNYFHLMVDEYGIKAELDHYACIVDLLGRAGRIDDAHDFICDMPMKPNAIIWGSLLSACRQYHNFRVGIWAAKNRLLLEPNCAATYVQLANLFASAGYWEDAAKARKWMKEKGLKTSPGYSWIEVGNTLCKFRVEERSSPEMKEVYSVLDCLQDQMRNLGYVPAVEFHEEA
ncbi:Pentatricopeptide repeat-containing protein [Nymphaea thermarum]|nr:Pentatricopeptide repeat-containing protein [Nymphaea thermarum]